MFIIVSKTHLAGVSMAYWLALWGMMVLEFL